MISNSTGRDIPAVNQVGAAGQGMMTEAERITRALGGSWTGKSGICRCPAHDDQTPSLSVAAGHDGRLLLRCFAGCGFADVLAALRQRGILNGTGPAPRPSPTALARQEALARAQLDKRIRQARAIWVESQPIDGTLGERYLRNRAITGPIPRSIRFHPACWHKIAVRLGGIAGSRLTICSASSATGMPSAPKHWTNCSPRTPT